MLPAVDRNAGPDNDYFGFSVPLSKLLLQLHASARRLRLIAMIIAADSVAALTAIAVFVVVLFVVLSANARRAREAARREWQATLQARGA